MNLQQSNNQSKYYSSKKNLFLYFFLIKSFIRMNGFSQALLCKRLWILTIANNFHIYRMGYTNKTISPDH